ncbi:MAG: phytoene desaturase [Bacteroidales bacterium]|nr:phytoene desaturase [Bacteroidales bacterium]MCF8457160.1 phytoene desaturase [Bacteroidales bacterium]
MKKAIIIGTGIAAIASAIRFSAKGYQVTVLEQNEKPGGKIREFHKDGFRFDMGPSLFTMPWLVDELFECCGENPGDFFNYTKLEQSCRYFYSDEKVVDAFQDKEKLTAELETKLGEDAKSIHRYLNDAEEIYKLTAETFIFNSLQKSWNIQKKYIWPALKKLSVLRPWQTIHKANEGYFSNPKTLQIFDRLATYNGSNPYKAPATLNVIAHLEHNQGAYFPINGMASIIESLYELAKRQGVEFRFNQKVKQIVHQKGIVSGVETSDGFVPGEIVVSNADIFKSYELLPGIELPHKMKIAELSTSALVFFWGMNREFPEIGLHNILFAEYYKAEFEYLNSENDIYGDPTIYIYVSSKQVSSDAPAGKENWFVMVNAPTDSGQDWDLVIQKARKTIQQKINRILGANIEEHILFEEIIDPKNIEEVTSAQAGAIYGNSSNNMMAAFRRHPNFSKDIKGLYFAGGSVHPGGGIPLCLASAKIVDGLISKNE